MKALNHEKSRRAVPQGIILISLTLVLLPAIFFALHDSRSATANHADMVLPWTPGETWYVCVGYVSTTGLPSHTGEQKFSLDLVASPGDIGVSNGCKPGASTSKGKIVRAPTDGKIAWIGSTATDVLCIDTQDSHSLKVGHITIASGLKGGDPVKKDQTLGEVNVPNDLNNNVAHIHIGLFNDNVCGKGGGGTGITIPFDSRFAGVSLPDKGQVPIKLDTYSH